MKFHQSIYQNNNSKIIKYLILAIFISILSFKANTEIPEKYKIESSLPQCKGTDYREWNECYSEYKFPRIEYKGEWKNGTFHGKGILKEAWGDIYIGDFVNNKAEGFGRQDIYNSNGELDGSFEGELKNDYLNGQGYYEIKGCRYEGLFKDHYLNGEGKVTCESGYQAKGIFKDDELNGQGFESWEGGTTKSGEYKDGYLNGKGEINWDSGGKEIGTFLEGDLNGYGIKIWSSGTKYEGDWVKGKGTGKAVITYNNGVYTGETENSLEHGKGTYKWNFGDVYTGDWVKGNRTGKGVYKYESGDEYIGQFLDGLRDGKGIYKYENGDVFDGSYALGSREGKGKFSYANGNIFIGTFKNDWEEGYGVFTWSDGDKYEGNWIDGYRTGKGKYTYASGTVYEGDFKDNYGEGDGVITYSNGDKYVGKFLDGYEHGEGVYKFENGDEYTGQFKEGYMHGKGKMVYANGDIYEGLWEDGKEAEGKTTLAKYTTDEKYYALIIGNNDYEKLEDLENAVNDAKDLEKVLKEKYGFETTLRIDKKSGDIVDEIINFTKNREKNDNILIYYAGHGQLVKKQKRGYWLPTDAGPTQDSKWISNLNIKDLIAASDAKHILLIVDSCFAGSLMRGSGENKSVEKLTETSIKRLQKKKTRLVMTSGGNERVADGIGDSKNSVFAEPLIKALKENNNVIRSIELFQTVQNYVINNAEQTPNHSLIHGTGHNGGEFLFFPKG